MKCEVCGTENEYGTSFCRNCGHELIKEQNNYEMNNQSAPKKNDEINAPIILGIVSLAMALMGFPLVPTITAIIGLVLAIKVKNDNNKILAIILNGAALFIKLIQFVVIIFILLAALAIGEAYEDSYSYDSYEPFESNDTSMIEGTYYCSKKHHNSDEFEKIVTIDEEVIKIEDYESPLETYLTGGYTSKYNSVLEQYDINIYVEEEYKDGEEQKSDYKMHLNINVDDDKYDITIDHNDIYECQKRFEGI